MKSGLEVIADVELVEVFECYFCECLRRFLKIKQASKHFLLVLYLDEAVAE